MMNLKVASDIVTVSFKDVKFDELLENLVKAAQLKNYRITKIVSVDNIKERKNLVKDLRIGFKHYKIVEICNLFKCNDLISSDLRAGVFMPVRFAVYQKAGGKTVDVSYLKPTAFARLFGSERMAKVAGQLERDMKDVVSAAEF